MNDKNPRSARQIAFDTQAAIAAAWKLLWSLNLKDREEGRDYRGSSYHLTASDIERQVRRFAEDTMEGRPWATERSYGGYGSRVRFRGNLQGTVRKWLFNEVSHGRLSMHNFGRGHISGARFRPAGEPVGPAEKGTMERKERSRGKPRPRHFRRGGHGSSPICVTKKARWNRSSALSCKTEADVTCPRCLKLLKAAK